jgi:hypothetical protein
VINYYVLCHKPYGTWERVHAKAADLNYPEQSVWAESAYYGHAPQASRAWKPISDTPYNFTLT